MEIERGKLLDFRDLLAFLVASYGWSFNSYFLNLSDAKFQYQ
jgi:hypothetical protein